MAHQIMNYCKKHVYYQYFNKISAKEQRKDFIFVYSDYEYETLNCQTKFKIGILLKYLSAENSFSKY